MESGLPVSRFHRGRRLDRMVGERMEARSRRRLMTDPASQAAFAAWLSSATAAAVVARMAIAIVVNFAISALFAKKPKQDSAFQDQLVTAREAAPVADIVVGEVRKGGSVRFMAVNQVKSENLSTDIHHDVIPEASPYTVTVPAGTKHRDALRVVVREWVDGNGDDDFQYRETELTEVVGTPAAGQYSVVDATGVYTFNAAQAGMPVAITHEFLTDHTFHSQVLHLVIVLAGHEVEEIGDMYFNDRLVPIDANGNALGANAGFVKVYKHLGSDDQTVDTVLQGHFPNRWTSSHRGRGLPYVYVQLRRKEVPWPTGVPNITFIVKGGKHYDPRVAATAWTPNGPLVTSGYLTSTRYGLGHTYATEIDEALLTSAANIADEEVLLSTANATEEFTATASTDVIQFASKKARMLQTGDGVRVANTGGALPAGLSAATTYYARRSSATTAGAAWTLHATLAGAYANTGKVDITDAGTGTHALTYYSEPRYRFNGVIPTSEQPKDILGRFKVAMVGHILRIGGKWRIYAGAYITPINTYDEDDFRGEFTVDTLLSRREGCNGVQGIYSSPDNNWQPSDFPPVQVDQYVTDDNDEEIWLDLELPLTTSGAAAQRIAKAILEQARRQITVSAPIKLTGYRDTPPGTIMLDNTMLGWNDKVFELNALTLRLDTGGQNAAGGLVVDASYRETDENVWDFDAETLEEPTVRAQTTALPDPFDIAPPGKPAVTESLYQTREGGGVKAKASISWSASPDGRVDTYDFWWRKTSETTWQKRDGIVGLETEVLDIEPSTYVWRVRAVVSQFSARSAWAQTRREIQGLNSRPATPVIVSIVPHGNGALLTLEPSTSLDVTIGGRWLIRHSVDVSPAWENSVSIGEAGGYPGGNVMLAVPLKAGTYLVKAEDSGGRRSSDAVSYEMTQDSVNEYTTVTTYDLATLWGAVVGSSYPGAVYQDGILKLKGAGNFDDIPDLDAVDSLDDFGGVSPSSDVLLAGTLPGTATIDLGSSKRVRVTSILEASTVNVNDSLDNRTNDIDDWADFDGTAGGGSADAWVGLKIGDGELRRVDAIEVTARYLKFSTHLRSTDPAYNIHVTAGQVAVEEIV